MQLTLRILVAILGLLFNITIFYFLIKRRINERNALFWFVGAILILFISLVPKLLDNVSSWLGVDYPPTLLFLVAILAVLLVLFHQTIVISELQEKCRELAQALALVTNKDKNF